MSEANDRRSPYLVLGIDYGTPLELARQAFARRARHIRRSERPVYSTEDLTWALHAIETVDDPSTSVQYFRVPANRANLASAVDGELFRPAPIALRRLSPVVSTDQLDALSEQVARELAERLLASAAPVPCDDPYGLD